MNNILIILNGPPYGTERGRIKARSEHVIHADKVLIFQQAPTIA